MPCRDAPTRNSRGPERDKQVDEVARGTADEGRHMQISPGRLGALALVGIGAAAVITSCAVGRSGGGSSGSGPMAGLTNQLMANLAGSTRAPAQLSLATQSTFTVKRDNGSIQGVYDGRSLLTAADTHQYGTPTITDAAKDKRGDGIATFNEVRHVVQHFDADGSLDFNTTEKQTFEATAGLRWIPGDS